jgi:paraquat-inducible protein B
MPDNDNMLPQVPEAKTVTEKRTRLSFVWIFPLVAAAAGAWVAVNKIRSEGPRITIVFRSAEGLEASKTKIRYNGVDVGTVTAFRLTDDHRRVIATAKMAPRTEGFLLKDTKFWVVRPQISGATVTGLGTLISGAYLGMEIGQAPEPERNFIALETPPVVAGDTPGRFFVLKTPELGSLDRGTPVYSRHLKVGQVVSYELDTNGVSLTVRIFVQAPYDQYVTPNTRFWQASGIDMSLSASGLRLQTESFLSMLIGGLAFETPATGPLLPPAEPDTQFTLFSDRAEAFKPPPSNPQSYLFVFNQSVRGLTVGAPVEMKGIQIGEVTEIRAQFDEKTHEFTVPVTVRVDPARFGVKMLAMPTGAEAIAAHRKLMDLLVARGLRAQLQTGSLISGSLFVAVDFFPDAPPATLDWSQNPVQLPTMPGQIEVIEASLANIMKKIEAVPLKGIGDDLQKAINELNQTLVTTRGTLTNTDQLLGSANKVMGSADRILAPNSVLDAQLASMLQELGGAARAMRVLADYLERHPEALIRGKTGEAK